MVLTLALGIGANTAIFSVVDALLLRWLPVRSPQELVQVSLCAARRRLRASSAARSPIRSCACWPSSGTSSRASAAFSASRLNVGPPEAVTRVPAAIVTGGFFETLGLEARVGRLLTPADDVPGRAAVAVISHGYWERQFGGSDDVIGHAIC